MSTTIRTQLVSSLDATLADELLEAHSEAKRNFFLGGLRLSAVEGGRFCEAAFRILEYATSRRYTPLGTSLDTDKLIQRLSNLPRGGHPDSIRLHIPRALRVVYDVRNNRDAAHLADGIDPNLQDSSLVVGVIDWVLAEFIRLYHKIPPNEAQAIVENIVTRAAQVIQDFNGFPKTLNPALEASDRCLLLLYWRGATGATFEELKGWVKPSMRSNLRRTLGLLTDDKDLAHYDDSRYYITRRGQQDIERRRLIEPA